MLKVGDKVRFLNAVGGGIVTRIDKSVAMVEEEDGFETPVLLHECVIIETGQTERKVAASQKSKIVEPEFPRERRESVIPVTETKEGEKLNMFLAYVPVDPKVLQTTAFDAYLINDSNYYLFFSYLCKTDAGWNTRYAGLVEPNIQLHIEEFGKNELNDLERICIQYVAYKKDKPFSLKNTASVEYRLDPVKFYKLHSFRENNYMDEDAIVLPIVKNDVPERSVVLNAREIEIAIKSKKEMDKPERQPVVKKNREDNEVVEIDLHIHELLDSTAGMDNTEILNYQLEKFREVLNEYSSRKGQKIVFIHGKGDGVLRNAVLNELRTKYKTYYYQDASFREYGFGATMVTIR